MKIAFISAGGYMDQEDYIGGNLLGTEYQIFALSKEFVKKGHDVTIFRKWHQSGTAYIENVKILSFKATNFKKPGLNLTLSKLKFSKIAAKNLKNINSDILIIIDPYTSYFVNKLGIPKMLVTHTMIPFELLPFKDLKMNIYQKILLYINEKIQEKLFDKSDVIVALNNDIKICLSNKGYKTILIPNGIDIERYIPNYSDEKYVLFGGRLVKEKGINYLINAYSMISEELQREYKLVIIGFGHEKIYLEKLVADLGIKDRVDFIPWLSTQEFMKQISNCSIFVLPSLFETFGIVITEAMALGKPVIASDVIGSRSIINNGINGYLFIKGNIYELSKYLELLLNNIDLRRKIGENARMTVEEKYSIKTVANMYIDIFNELLSDTNE